MTKSLEHLDLAGGIGKLQNRIALKQSSVVHKEIMSTSNRKMNDFKIMPYIQIDHPFHLKNDLKFAFTYSDESVSIGSSVCSGLRNSLHSSLSSLSLEYTDLNFSSDSSPDEEAFDLGLREEVPSWRLSPEQNKSDWSITIESVPEGTVSRYHVHKRVLVNGGIKGSDFFARLINDTDITDTKPIKIHEDAAKLMQNMLDYMYAIDDELEITSDSAVGLRHLSQFFGIRGLAKRVNCFINEDISLDTMDVYLETTSAFDDMQTIDLLADRCASEIEKISPLSSLVAEMDPSFILSIVSSQKFNRRKHSSHMSHIMTGYFITQRGAIDGHVFEELTAEECLPYVDQEAALPLLILEAALVRESADETTPLSSLQLRCIEGILPMFSSSANHSIGDGEKKSRQTAMLKIPRKVLAEILSMLPIK
uniref:BTB domain-containing protein n=1 Tax=Pseudo-nitzschia australis TaxID=44445 RepID=A0A7S4AWR2_9STRA